MVKGRIVAISGAAGGLGPSVVRAFSRDGATLAVAGRDEAKLSLLLDEAGVPADRRLATRADLSEPGEARRWADAVAGAFGRVDVVLHLVGGYTMGTSIEEITTEEWTAIQKMLVTTTMNVASAFAARLRTGGWGRFIGVTSPKAQSPTAKSALYAMGKAASDALVLALADELRGTGATANLIVVDSIDTPEARPPHGTGTDGRKAYGKSTPAEEIAAAMLFLCSEEAATINGVRLPLTGRG
jgi:NAD(P)-dependent dehydrogenase (short-subunit alcohol dehydrogenase family)